jgi:hypothetical protein
MSYASPYMHQSTQPVVAMDAKRARVETEIAGPAPIFTDAFMPRIATYPACVGFTVKVRSVAVTVACRRPLGSVVLFFFPP